VLLARVAEDLYWAARYLERAEDTARIVREHTNLIVDFPVSVPLTWEPLIAVTGGSVGDLPGRHSEIAIVTGLVSDQSNPSSIAWCVERARENLRTCREVIPQDFWLTVNDLHLYVSSHADEGVDRRSRNRFLSRVIAETQRAVSLLETGEGQLADVQWAGVLRSLSALQMYHRTRHEPVEAAPVVEFLLRDRDFPRSVRCCLGKVAASVVRLPRPERLTDAVGSAIARIERGPGAQPAGTLAAEVQPDLLRAELDGVQLALAGLSDRIGAAYFRPA
jgi:uncharacterized alpha-E superfamily protein